VEAVDPAGSPTHESWEPRLLESSYRFGLFDGLNRFYCREEDAENLLPRLAAPLRQVRLAIRSEGNRWIYRCEKASAYCGAVMNNDSPPTGRIDAAAGR
jgi:hypothetical protein